MRIAEKLLQLITRKDLEKPISDIRTAKLHDQFSETVVAGLTPPKMAEILKEAAAGEVDRFLSLAEEMEELDPHYGSVLRTRKLAVAAIEPEVAPASDSDLDQKIAEFVKDIVTAPEFSDLIVDLLDGLGKGYAVCEIEWDISEAAWVPAAYVWREPRGFVYDKDCRQIMQRLDNDQKQELPLGRFITHVPKLKSGLPVRGALARLAAWSFLYKNYTIKDWMRFVEVYGMPLRVGKWHEGASEAQKRQLLRAVVNMGSDAAAAIPASMMIEFVQTASATSAQGPVFGVFAKYLDAQISKAVLGQTMTTDDGSSKAQAEVHDDVRMDIRAADARQVTMSLQKALIIPAVVFNFGVQKKYPRVRLPVAEPEDIKAWTQNTATFMDRGLEVSQAQVRDKLNLEVPASAEDVLVAKKPNTPAEAAQEEPVEGNPAKKAKTHQQTFPAPCPGCGQTALTAQSHKDGIDQLAAQAVAEGGGELDGIIEPILALAAQAKDYDDFMALLSASAGSMATGALVDKLGPLMFLSRALGDASDKPEG